MSTPTVAEFGDVHDDDDDVHDVLSSSARLAEVRPLAYGPKGAARRANCSLSHINNELRTGNLRARRMGRRLVILDAEIQRYLNSLPVYTYAPEVT